MNERQPSRTALGAAGYRAAHQQLEGGKVFSDPLACTILGDDADAIIAGLSADPAQQRTRIFMAARSRFAEDCLGAAVSRGVRQAVVLGAGFDTFALRNPYSDLGLRVFEVDHAATQAWKRRRLSEVGLAIPASLTFAAIDFETDDLGRGLRDAGFDPDRPGARGDAAADFETALDNALTAAFVHSGQVCSAGCRAIVQDEIYDRFVEEIGRRADRIRLGVGTGWNYVEYDSLGQDFATRGPRLDDQGDPGIHPSQVGDDSVGAIG